ATLHFGAVCDRLPKLDRIRRGEPRQHDKLFSKHDAQPCDCAIASFFDCCGTGVEGCNERSELVDSLSNLSLNRRALGEKSLSVCRGVSRGRKRDGTGDPVAL